MTRKVTESMRDMVTNMCRIGYKHDRIAEIVGMSPKTLRRHFREELDFGSDNATAQVAATLFELATGGNVAACIFWMKTRAGWSEKFEVTGKDGEPLLPVTDAERADLGRRLAYTLAAGAKANDEEVKH